MRRNRMTCEYAKICAEFSTPVTATTFCRQFDASRAIRAAKAAGAKIFWATASDSKGNSLFPTAYGLPHPQLKGRNYLQEMIEAAHAEGLGIVAYYNVWSPRVAEAHPEWCMRFPKSYDTPEPCIDMTRSLMCLNSPGLDEMELPQFAEIAALGPDAIFLDFPYPGNACFCESCRQAYRQRFGCELPWVNARDAWVQYKKWMVSECGESWRARIAEAIHAVNPGILIGSNQAYSLRFPLDVPEHQGFVTLDIHEAGTSTNLNTDREGRYMAMLRTGGEIMTTVMPGWWGHWAVKPAIQGKQEAATVLSLGLTTHIGLPTYREGRIEQNTLDTVSEIFRFIEERADYSRYGQLVTDVAVLHSYHTQLRHTAAFTVPPALEGAAKALHDTQIHYGIIGESALPADASEIKLLVLPEQQWLRDDDVEKIRNYVRSGGKVLATGTTSAGEGAIPALADVFGIECFGRACGSPWYVRPTATALISEFALNAPLMTPGEDVMLVKAAPPAEAWGRLLGPRRGSAFHFDEPDDDVDGWAGIIHHRFGRGEAVYVPAPLFDAFRKKNFFALRKLVRRLIDLLLPERMVVLDAPYALGVSLLRQNGRHVLHLVNHYTESTLADNTPTVVEHLPRLTDIAVTLRLNGEKPRSVTLQPEGRELSSHFHQGTLTFVVPEIHVHGCVVIEG